MELTDLSYGAYGLRLNTAVLVFSDEGYIYWCLASCRLASLSYYTLGQLVLLPNNLLVPPTSPYHTPPRAAYSAIL